MLSSAETTEVSFRAIVSLPAPSRLQVVVPAQRGPFPLSFVLGERCPRDFAWSETRFLGFLVTPVTVRDFDSFFATAVFICWGVWSKPNHCAYGESLAIDQRVPQYVHHEFFRRCWVREDSSADFSHAPQQTFTVIVADFISCKEWQIDGPALDAIEPRHLDSTRSFQPSRRC